jgi:hypothetical protein
MKTENSSRDLSANADAVSVSESAKRQIAAKVLDSKAQLSGSRLGPSFFEGFFDGPLST